MSKPTSRCPTRTNTTAKPQQSRNPSPRASTSLPRTTCTTRTKPQPTPTNDDLSKLLVEKLVKGIFDSPSSNVDTWIQSYIEREVQKQLLGIQRESTRNAMKMKHMEDQYHHMEVSLTDNINRLQAQIEHDHEHFNQAIESERQKRFSLIQNLSEKYDHKFRDYDNILAHSNDATYRSIDELKHRIEVHADDIQRLGKGPSYGSTSRPSESIIDLTDRIASLESQFYIQGVEIQSSKAKLRELGQSTMKMCRSLQDGMTEVQSTSLNLYEWGTRVHHAIGKIAESSGLSFNPCPNVPTSSLGSII